MDPKILATVSLRALATLFGLQGRASAAESLNLLASGIQAGLNVDAHMQVVADYLAAGNEAAFAGLNDRINADGARLQAKATDTG